jgi:hypothetical protein
LTAKRELYEYFKGVRPGNEGYYELLDAGENDQLILESFFHSRLFGYHTAAGEARIVFMPIIDLVNHNARADFLVTPVPGNVSTSGLSMNHCRLATTNNELFINYYNDDALYYYLNYGFVDESLGCVRSIPFKFDLEGVARFNVSASVPHRLQNYMPQATREILAALEERGLLYQYPRVTNAGKSTFDVSHLIIPSARDSDVLRRILESVIRYSADSLIEAGKMDSLVVEFEAKVLEVNTRFYDDLATLLIEEDVPLVQKNMLKQLVGVQQCIMAAYKDRWGL